VKQRGTDSKMFIGHFAVGLGVKSVKPQISLGLLFLACQFLDLLWPVFLLLGWEKVEIKPGISVVTPLDFVSYPFSHSLVMAIIWGILVGITYWLIRKEKTLAIIVGCCVVSHWILDLIVHIPDLPLYPGDSPKVGLALWNSIIGSQLVEGIFLIVGVMLYLRSTAPKNKTGVLSFWSLIIFLVAIHISNLIGPPPPNVEMIAWAGQAQWLIVLWGFWIDKNRKAKISARG
ncbi:MAG TPA: metal-dependent hydrolase, partial [Cyclobacteriaceae bacterium]|nr:metal-dependent hydrolase [Cyclobacteriaceae bacterium]